MTLRSQLRAARAAIAQARELVADLAPLVAPLRMPPRAVLPQPGAAPEAAPPAPADGRPPEPPRWPITDTTGRAIGAAWIKPPPTTRRPRK